ncbi:uncharacterized protein LOC131244093 [Magnolia sinica]|uniref:uncharacterized protein LOC131244093 n=1 Tax=Magnolia sinica TaxID=86752 RepID=UPI00265A1F4C|nr:uncharacterized protein LOC131244093 [Magnolia sinica]
MIVLWQQMHCLLREEDGATMLRLASHEKKTIWVHPRRLGLMSTSPWLGGECHFACYGNDQVLRHQLANVDAATVKIVMAGAGCENGSKVEQVPFTKFIYWNGMHAGTF